MATERQIRTYWREEFVLVALLLVIFCGIIVFGLRLPFDARLFPMVVGTTGVVLCGLIVAAEVRRQRMSPALDPVKSDDPAIIASGRRYALALSCAPAFGLLLWLFGFFVASLVAMLAMPWLMGFRKKTIIGAVAFMTVVTLSVAFPYALGVSLPLGLVGDWLVETFQSH